ncbi:MAG TPA: hypothetical protein VMT11_06670 [Myxococcaceae bacterium]|nr:hypothetical protein [Myxococcaceae bacterium]
MDPIRERPGLTTQIADALIRRFLETPVADALIERVVQALMRSPELDQLVTQVVADLEASPVVDSLVDRQIARVLEELRESEDLQLLIRKQAGEYLQHLGEHPEPVQRLIREQSRGVVDEFLAALRERALAADDTVDGWVRRALGRA